MKEAKSKFGDQNKQSWKELALLGLKGVPYERIQSEVESGLILDPLYVKDEVQSFDPINWSSTAGGWKIAENFEWKNDVHVDELNKTILNALRGGCQVLNIKLHPSIDPQPEVLLRGVLLELISLRLELSSGQLSEFSNFFDQYASNNNLNRADLFIQYVNHTLEPFNDMTHDDAYSVQLTKVIQQIEHYLLSHPDQHWNNILINVPIGNHFLAEVSKLRALKILIHGLADKLDKPLTQFPTLAAQVIPFQIKDELETLIERTSLATAAVLGGVDEICIAWNINTEMKLSSTDQRSVNRNIHWLLKKESQLSAYTDPLNGAYWIEHCTREFVNRVWANLKTGDER